MRTRPLLFALAIATIVAGYGFALNAAAGPSTQPVTREGSAAPARAPVFPEPRPEPSVDRRMLDLERSVRVNMILYKGQFGQPAPLAASRLDAVAVTVVPGGR